MDDVPLGAKTVTWADEAAGSPGKKTDGCPRYDSTIFNMRRMLALSTILISGLRRAGSPVMPRVKVLGVPLNKKGGGEFEKKIRAASELNAEDRVQPDPDLWPLPYGYFAIRELVVSWLEVPALSTANRIDWLLLNEKVGMFNITHIRGRLLHTGTRKDTVIPQKNSQGHHNIN